MAFVWPWQQQDPETGIAIAQYEEPAGPLDKNGLFYPPLDSGEFNPIQTVQNTASEVISKVSTSTARMFGNAQLQVASKQQADLPWYDITGRISASASAANSAVQSTLLKVIVLVAIVGVIALFGMSYVQTKGAKLANAS
jgi:hypothetical protein